MYETPADSMPQLTRFLEVLDARRQSLRQQLADLNQLLADMDRHHAEAERTLRMETGPLAGRVAQVRESSGKPAIVFIRKENEVDGRPTIDISDTWCYFEPR